VYKLLEIIFAVPKKKTDQCFIICVCCLGCMIRMNTTHKQVFLLEL